MKRADDGCSGGARCTHATLRTEPSAHADEVGYRRASSVERRQAESGTVAAASTAKTKSKRRRVEEDDGDDAAASSSSSYSAAAAAASSSGSASAASSSSSFPAPLLLPGDDLALDPECPGQSFGEWLASADSDERNEVTADRRTIYVVAPPLLAAGAPAAILQWTKPNSSKVKQAEKEADVDASAASSSAALDASAVAPPSMSEVVSYLSAFYHGMTVKVLPHPLTFAAWDSAADSSSSAASSSSSSSRAFTPRYIGLNTSSECIRIRTRASLDGIYSRQLHLDDLLDAALAILPSDAYALLMLVEHDLYETKDDLFCCGRAYGASRVALTSSARYHPALDAAQGVERVHAWPASHCEEYIKQQIEGAAEEDGAKKKKKSSSKKRKGASAAAVAPAPSSSAAAASASFLPPSALAAAVAAHSALGFSSSSVASPAAASSAAASSSVTASASSPSSLLFSWACGSGEFVVLPRTSWDTASAWSIAPTTHVRCRGAQTSPRTRDSRLTCARSIDTKSSARASKRQQQQRRQQQRKQQRRRNNPSQQRQRPRRQR